MDIKMEKPSKKSLYYLVIVLAAALLVFAGLLYYLYYLSRPAKTEKPTGRSMEEIIESLSAPGESSEAIPEEVQKSLSAPFKKEGQGEISEDILKSLSAPE